MADKNRKVPWAIGFVKKEKNNLPETKREKQNEIIDMNERSLGEEAENNQESWGEAVKLENFFVEDGKETEAQVKEELHTKEVNGTEKILEEAIKLHDLGVAGDKKAVVEAHKLLKEFLEQEPENVEAKGYLGSIISLLGRDSINPNERMNKALEGLKILDQVVKINPENTQVRILRANVCYRLPEMYFHRTDTAVEDFKHMISRYEKDQNIFTESYYLKLLYDLGGAYKNLNRHDEAKKTWQKLLEVTSDEKYIKLLKKEGITKSKKDKKGEKADIIQELPVTKEVDLIVKPLEEEPLSNGEIIKSDEPIAAQKDGDGF